MSCLCHYGPALLRFWFQTYLGHENSATYLKTQVGKTFSYLGHAVRLIFMAKIWQVSSCGKFMQHLGTCLLWQLKLTEFCVNLWCFFNVFFHWMYKMKYSCYQETSVIHGAWFVYWIFGWEIRRLSKSEIRFWMASFLFFTLLDRCVRLGSDAVLVVCRT